MFSKISNLRSVRLCFNKFYSSSSNLVDVSVNDKNGIATVTMQRPPVNSLNLDLLAALRNTIYDLEKNKSKGMILTSACETVFSAGLDIMEMYKPEEERVKSFWSTLQDTWLALYGSSFPTAAAINGHSPAGGCFLASSCEYRVMVPNFTIGLNEARLGIVAPSWFVATMKNTIGFRKTEMALTLGHLFSTEDAFKVGLIDEIASNKDEAIAKAEKFLEKFAIISPSARAISKLMIRGKDIENLKKTREQDLNQFVNIVREPKTQKELEKYLGGLKKKKI